MTLSPYLTIRTPLFNSFLISIAGTRTFKNIEFEQDQEIPFLAVLIKCQPNNSFSTSIYRKKMVTALYTPNSPVKIFSNATKKLQLMKEWCDQSRDLVWANSIKTSQKNGDWNYGSWPIHIQATHNFNVYLGISWDYFRILNGGDGSA